MTTLKTQEVAVLLGKSGDQVRRDYHNGLISARKSGRELIFDRNEVIRFAESRGIHINQTQPESEVAPQGESFFTHWARVIQNAPPGATVAYTAPPRAGVA